MDKGAARSRKRQNLTGDIPNNPADPSSKSSMSKQHHIISKQHLTESRPIKPLARPRDRNRLIIKKPSRGPQSKDPSLYVSKAVRTSAALIWNQAPFPVPPPKDVLANVRRVDLTGSGLTDVSWLTGMGVTWLSLAGCKVEKGWEAVGSLTELSVLNISDCGLTYLPTSLRSLKTLKAVVAMNNNWTELDDEVVSEWKELNSLIVSHSPNLTALPTALTNLHQLAKLTFSHSPRLTATSLPDLSSLPLLRDVKMNNLPHLTSLPAHITRWGTGDMSLAGKSGPSTTKLGDGLEVLDLGNCSLTFPSASSIFGLLTKQTSSKKVVKPAWPHLRSLSLHSNPLTISHPNYIDLLQQSADLPDLQIIDAKRVKERKRKGEISESKLEKKHREKKGMKMKPSGANVGGGIMRSWGQTEAEGEVEDVDVDVDAGVDGAIRVDSEGEGAEGGGGEEPHKKRKRKRKNQVEDPTQPLGKGSEPLKRTRHELDTKAKKTPSKPIEPVPPPPEPKQKKKKHRHASPSQHVPSNPIKPTPAFPSKPKEVVNKHDLPADPPNPHSVQLAADAADPSTLAQSRQKPSKTETSVLQVIEVIKPSEKMKKGKIRSGEGKGGGLDLKAIFGGGKTSFKGGEVGGEGDGGGGGSGLGVGGW